jgi:thiol-disulfide isomerase/thioredoxin
MVGMKRVDDFALLDLEGHPWQFRRDRQGKLVLLDFWHTRCGPCLRAIPHLNELQKKYGRDGLEVIGIACESGPPEGRARQVQALRWANGAPFRFDYRVLLGGDQGPQRPCPVSSSFCVAAYPTLKLLDEQGWIVWESQGLGDSQLNELKREIERRLAP